MYSSWLHNKFARVFWKWMMMVVVTRNLMFQNLPSEWNQCMVLTFITHVSTNSRVRKRKVSQELAASNNFVLVWLIYFVQQVSSSQMQSWHGDKSRAIVMILSSDPRRRKSRNNEFQFPCKSSPRIALFGKRAGIGGGAAAASSSIRASDIFFFRS